MCAAGAEEAAGEDAAADPAPQAAGAGDELHPLLGVFAYGLQVGLEVTNDGQVRVESCNIDLTAFPLLRSVAH